MSRYIKPSFWTDSYIKRCNTEEKLVFLYLLTNPQANIAGVYEIQTDTIAFQTKVSEHKVVKILEKFQSDKKIYFKDDWIVICNHIKHQSLGESTTQGINRIVENSPDFIKELFNPQVIPNSKGENCILYTFYPPCTPPTHPPETGVELSKVKLSSISINGNVEIDLPEWLDKSVWEEWRKHRQEKKQKLTPTSIKNQIIFLENRKSDYIAIIKQSITNGWTGLFDLKSNSVKTAQPYRNSNNNLLERAKKKVMIAGDNK